ncbi:MAG: tyrosine-type recombinase/integrase, partial [Cyanobacteria bacterium REEB65]|nr:tyrosine-type recombinase/integrase [Cyanobacteria bacterium REEB65]
PARIPPQAFAERTRLDAVEQEARQRAVRGASAHLDAFLAEHVARYRNLLTRKNVEAVTREFLAWCQDRGIERVSQVNKEICQQWIDAIARDQAYTTVKRKRAQLARAWSRSLGRRRISESPWLEIELDGYESTKVRGSWTREEYEKVKAAAHPWLRDVIILGVNTGLRINALIKLEWRDWIHPQTEEDRLGYVRVRKELDKTGAGYDVPISPELHTLLGQRFGKHDEVFMLTGRFNKPISGRNITHRAIRSACRKAGIHVPDLPNHHMRRTFGRWAHLGLLTGTPVPLYVVSRWLGHRSIKTTLIYLDISEEQSAQWMVPDLDVPQSSPSP